MAAVLRDRPAHNPPPYIPYPARHIPPIRPVPAQNNPWPDRFVKNMNVQNHM